MCFIRLHLGYTKVGRFIVLICHCNYNIRFVQRPLKYSRCYNVVYCFRCLLLLLLLLLFLRVALDPCIRPNMKLSLVAQMVFVVIFASLLATPTPTSASNPTKRPKSKRVSGEPSLRHRPSTRRPATTTPQRVVDEHRSQRHQQQSHRQQLQQQRELVKKTLLSILGLKSEPKPRGKVRVPIYMMKLYDELSRRNHLRQQQQQQLAPKIMKRHGKRSQYDGDTIRSFQAIFVGK